MQRVGELRPWSNTATEGAGAAQEHWCEKTTRLRGRGNIGNIRCGGAQFSWMSFNSHGHTLLFPCPFSLPPVLATAQLARAATCATTPHPQASPNRSSRHPSLAPACSSPNFCGRKGAVCRGRSLRRSRSALAWPALVAAMDGGAEVPVPELSAGRGEPK
jgi:hypothetical protein